MRTRTPSVAGPGDAPESAWAARRPRVPFERLRGRPVTAPVVSRTLAEALVALAARDGLGEPLNWHEVRASIQSLQEDPMGPRDLRYVLGEINNVADIAGTLEDWFIRAAIERDEDAKAAARSAEKILAPIYKVSLGGAATSGLGLVFGTLAGTVAVPTAICVLVVAAVAGYGRWKLSKREDEAISDAEGVRRLAAIAREARRPDQ